MTLLILSVALIVFGWRTIWLHDISANRFWHSNWWAVAGVLSVLIGEGGVIYSFGKMFGGVLE